MLLEGLTENRVVNFAGAENTGAACHFGVIKPQVSILGCHKNDIRNIVFSIQRLRPLIRRVSY